VVGRIKSAEEEDRLASTNESENNPRRPYMSGATGKKDSEGKNE
jgi:hypothetical protein